MATAVVSEDHSRQHAVQAAGRSVRYEFLAAQEDGDAPGGRISDRVVTDSASRLSTLPYVVTAAGDKDRVLCSTANGKSFARLGNPFNTPEIRIPDDVSAVEVYLGNDAFAARRSTPVFRVDLNAAGLTRVVIHELPAMRLRRLQATPATSTSYPVAPYAGTAQRPDGAYVGYLTGDVWKDLSHEFALLDVRRLCGPSTLTRPYAVPRGRERVRPGTAPAAAPPTVLDEPRPGPQFIPADTAATLPRPDRQGDLEILTISDWSSVLAPIYEGNFTNLIGTQHFDWGCTIDLPAVNIRLRYVQGAFANATGSGDQVTIADVLKRTHPTTYKGAIEAAWKSGIDELSISSTWRPMLGSVLHRMGVGLDIVFVDDYDDRDAQDRQISQFKVHMRSGARSALYRTFEAIVFADNGSLGGFKADPWINTDVGHQNHLHVSAVDTDDE